MSDVTGNQYKMLILESGSGFLANQTVERTKVQTKQFFTGRAKIVRHCCAWKASPQTKKQDSRKTFTHTFEFVACLRPVL